MAISGLFELNWAILPSILSPTDGLPLNGGSISFFIDSDPMTPKIVYELTTVGTEYAYTPLPNPVLLNASGQAMNSSNTPVTIYLKPFDDDGDTELYYIVVKDVSGNVVFTQQAWPNVATNAPDILGSAGGLDNQLANPQFTKVFINEGVTTTYTGSAAEQTFPLAPDWDLVIKGAGTVIVQREAIQGFDKVFTSPPYVLDITTDASIEYCQLRQRMNLNSGLWTTFPTTPGEDDRAVYLAGGILAQGVGASYNVKMAYIESDGSAGETIIFNEAAPTGTYNYLRATSDAIPASNNTDTGSDGYIDIYVELNASAHVKLSSIQVIPVPAVDGGDLLDFKIDSSNRNSVFLGDYTLPQLENRTQGNILTAWDFSLNPRQFGTSGSLSATAAYICDQTIAASGANAPTWAFGTTHNTLAFTTPNAVNGRFYVLQYLSGAEVRKIIGTRLSVNIDAYKDSAGNNITMKVFLCRGSSAATFPALPTAVGTVDASGDLTLTQANWTIIQRGGPAIVPDSTVQANGLGTATATLNVADTLDAYSDLTDHQFSGWEIEDETELSNTTRFAIFVTFAFTAGDPTTVNLNSVNVSTGDIPSRPIPERESDVLSQCRFYYEKSYNNLIAPGDVAVAGAEVRVMNSTDGLSGGGVSIRPADFDVRFETAKRVAPSIAFYSPTTGTVDTALVTMLRSSAASAYTATTASVVMTENTNWNFTSGQNGFLALQKNANLTTGTGTSDNVLGNLRFHWVAEARLGK